jgi:hypothetical protein
MKIWLVLGDTPLCLPKLIFFESSELALLQQHMNQIKQVDAGLALKGSQISKKHSSQKLNSKFQLINTYNFFSGALFLAVAALVP